MDGGVLINFANMTSATFDAKRDSITLEPGVLWEDAISSLQAFGVAPVGGRVG